MFGECENSAKEIPAKEAWNEAKICTYSSGGGIGRGEGTGEGPAWGRGDSGWERGGAHTGFLGSGEYKKRKRRRGHTPFPLSARYGSFPNDPVRQSL